MNKIYGDELIREQINSVGTLDGGVVFGREEAWEKLQARMESKSVRKFPLFYWRAAAAVLLLLLSGMTFYLIPRKQVIEVSLTRHSAEKAVVSAPVQPQPAALPAPAAATSNGEKGRVIVTENKHIKAVKSDMQKSIPTRTFVTTDMVTDNNNNVVIEPAQPETIVKPFINIKKVVQMNELGTGGGVARQTPVTSTATVVNYTKVVNYNDLEDNRSKRMMEESELKYQRWNIANKLNQSISGRGYSSLNPILKVKVVTQN